MTPGSLAITLRGERLCLLPEGALYWPAEKLLVVADFHLGKAETFCMNGYPLPGAAQSADLDRLVAISRREKVKTLVFLGDLVHTRAGLTRTVEEKFISTVHQLGVQVILTAGNHDQQLLREWPPSWAEIDVVLEWHKGPFLFRHEPPSPGVTLRAPLQADLESPFVWTGHLHPCIRISAGADRMRLKTFVVRTDSGVLPAFSSLAGGLDIPKDGKTRFYPLAEGQVFDLSLPNFTQKTIGQLSDGEP